MRPLEVVVTCFRKSYIILLIESFFLPFDEHMSSVLYIYLICITTRCAADLIPNNRTYSNESTTFAGFYFSLKRIHFNRISGAG